MKDFTKKTLEETKQKNKDNNFFLCSKIYLFYYI